MQTPICDFVQSYAESKCSRFHMPGHKGRGFLGCEHLDITEVQGADDLSCPSGIILQSEKNAAVLFGSRQTFYSVGGSSQCIKAMLYAALLFAQMPCENEGYQAFENSYRAQNSKSLQNAKGENKKEYLSTMRRRAKKIVAMRASHKAFFHACALLDLEPAFVNSLPGGECTAGTVCGDTSENTTYYSGTVSPKALDKTLCQMHKSGEKPIGVYITALDYLGNSPDIAALSKVCRRYGVPLLADNAHGAYLRFLKHTEYNKAQSLSSETESEVAAKSADESETDVHSARKNENTSRGNYTNNYMHPLNLGADICCDSAHKTLPALTGGAYLHVGKNALHPYENAVRSALSYFGTSSPSYLVLQSLDMCNKLLYGEYATKINECAMRLDLLKSKLRILNIFIEKSDPLRLVINAAEIGHSGIQLANLLRNFQIEPEYADDMYLVFMATPNTSEEDFERLYEFFSNLSTKKGPVKKPFIVNIENPEIVITPRSAMMSISEKLPIGECIGRVCAVPAVSCPPAVPIVMGGELVSEEVYKALLHYGVEFLDVVSEYY